MVPSCDRITSPSMYRSEGALYVLYRTLESSGQVNWMLCNATLRFRELKALLASNSVYQASPGVFFFGRTFDLVAGWQRICACAVPHSLCTLTLRRAC